MSRTLRPLSVEIEAGPGDYERARLVLELRSEIARLGLGPVDGGHGSPASDLAKGSGLSTGMLLVGLSNSAGLVALAGVLRAWVSRAGGRKVILRMGKDRIEVTQASSEQQHKLIQAWLEEHAGK
jgi:hypothetical protein